MLLMPAASITRASRRGLGPGNRDFFDRLDAISQGPKKVECGGAGVGGTEWKGAEPEG
jgi:hypothetical protein